MEFIETNENWQRILRQVLPHLSTSRIARLTRKSPRVVQKWHTGEMKVPLETFGYVVNQKSSLEYVQLGQKLTAVIDEALSTDLNREIIASHLAAEYKRVTGTEIE